MKKNLHHQASTKRGGKVDYDLLMAKTSWEEGKEYVAEKKRVKLFNKKLLRWSYTEENKMGRYDDVFLLHKESLVRVLCFLCGVFDFPNPGVGVRGEEQHVTQHHETHDSTSRSM